MTTQNTTTTATETMTRNEALAQAKALWIAGNSAGLGFAVGNDDDDINHIDETCYRCVVRSLRTNEPAVYEGPKGELVAVGDASGPWAVTIWEA